MNVLRFTLFALIETCLHQVESKDFKNFLDWKITSFAEEFKKLLDHQNLISLTQKHIMEKLTNLEPNIISNSGESEDECVCAPPLPCPTAEVIQSSNQLEPKLTTLNQKIQGILSRLNTMENPYRAIFWTLMKLVKGSIK